MNYHFTLRSFKNDALRKIKSQSRTKKISQVSNDDLILNLKGLNNFSDGKYSYCIQRFINTPQISVSFRNTVKLSLVVDIKTVEQAIIRIQIDNIPTFPVSYANTDKGIDLEDAILRIFE